MDKIGPCPICNMENTYTDGTLYYCPDCGHEWSSHDGGEDGAPKTRDSNGTELADGDSVSVIKDLRVKGSSMVIKQGTKVTNIRLTDNPEEIDGRVDGSAIVLRTEFMKKI